MNRPIVAWSIGLVALCCVMPWSTLTLGEADQDASNELASTRKSENSEPDVELIGINIAKATDAKGMMSVWAGPYVSDQGGTGFTFNIHANGRRFIRLDEVASKVIACVDDCGTDLNPVDFKGIRQRPPFSHHTYEEACCLSAFFPGRPHKDATKLKLDAEIALVCGKDLISKEQGVMVVKGDKITCGPFPLTIDSAREEKFNGANYVVVISSKERRDLIRSIEFLDADGKVIEQNIVNQSSFTDTNTGRTGCYTYHGFKSKPWIESIRVSYYAEVETIRVPVKVETGLGL